MLKFYTSNVKLLYLSQYSQHLVLKKILDFYNLHAKFKHRWREYEENMKKKIISLNFAFDELDKKVENNYLS